MRYRILILTATALLFIFNVPGWAQSTPLESTSFYKLSYQDFLNRLAQHNLSYAAEKYHIDMAEAEMEAAKILPDPELSFTVNDNQHRRMKMGYGFEVELEWDLELGGKRKARQALAQAERELAQLEVEQFFHELRTEATLAYLDALKSKMEYDLTLESYQIMKDLSLHDSLRYEKGEVRKSVATQSRLQAASKRNDLMNAASEMEHDLIDLNLLIKREKNDSIFIPSGDLTHLERDFELDELIALTLSKCGTLKIAQYETQVADHRVNLAKAEKVMDLGLSIGVENNSFEQNIVAPTPSHTAVFAGVSVPLQFSNKRDSSVKIARFEKEQANLLLAEKQLYLEDQITKAYRNYHNKQKQLKGLYELVTEAKQAYEEQTKDYVENTNSLLEVLNAERTYHQIQANFIDTLYEYAMALVELENEVGIWDIDF